MYVLIAAAGQGKRMGHDRNKLLLTLQGQPILAWTLARVLHAQPKWVGVMAQPADWPAIQTILTHLAPPLPVDIIPGGDTRQASVWNGLQALPPAADTVLIHDGARCLASPALFHRCQAALSTAIGVIAAIPVKDTIKVVPNPPVIAQTPERAHLWAAQTPQGFQVTILKACHAQALAQQWQVTDDAALLERCQYPVQVVLGEDTNLKITTPPDLLIAQALLNHGL
ncbi:2-C-methyl-D-erythritol 4-phosphate cytidylyltransferase [Gloeomargarita lithophora Alchichica-D10]|uniref:2-C-methyl-D-erythritol 4-phosphate cytidylyltransferase n=1 Tax=Gloeomargarita lithophora Alchichica-D10 TaxID=1188229 RepID=A0A1J0A9Y1_9CYAN|nr:2-C-methyl-D-erythritol 4-phosphate cytidylyltransferase [Gloeomargarita lithophora]APB32705.1 2-C-methyl-D-erythritol 4-phosphate cytidylyltransferase [Gloeomargarita lithophora Alchichica-D10]